jgi:hypothetical protein
VPEKILRFQLIFEGSNYKKKLQFPIWKLQFPEGPIGVDLIYYPSSTRFGLLVDWVNTIITRDL